MVLRMHVFRRNTFKFLSGVLIFRSGSQDSICVDLKRYFDLGTTAWSRPDTLQPEGAQRATATYSA
jgi:NAD-specific glutamate dehydrogenase